MRAMTDQPRRRAERRPEMIRQRRAERRKAVEQQRRQWLLTRLAIAAVALLIVVPLAYAGFSYVREQRARQPPAGIQTFSDLGNDHVEGPVAYTQVPPVGGDHSPIWQNCGFYAVPVRSEHAVHSLEHGAVWITYRPDLPGDQVTILRELAEELPFILVSPFPDLPAPVVASAWGNQLRLESADDSDLMQFVRAFRIGPQTLERGAACSGGTSQTT